MMAKSLHKPASQLTPPRAEAENTEEQATYARDPPQVRGINDLWQAVA